MFHILLEFITDMSVVKYDELLEKFNLNIKHEDFWQNAIDEIVDDIKKLENLLKEEKII